jgi:hypothetical protein
MVPPPIRGTMLAHFIPVGQGQLPSLAKSFSVELNPIIVLLFILII